MGNQYNPDNHHRRSIRLRDYDYREEGVYFVTICTLQRQCLLGDALGGEIQLNHFGLAVEECWEAIPSHFRGVELDGFVVMPNHVHGIIVLVDSMQGDRARHASPLHFQPRSQSGSLGTIVGSFKSAATRRINDSQGTHGQPVWQRNYYERIIRKENELNSIREYIACNPMCWPQDKNNPANNMLELFDGDEDL